MIMTTLKILIMTRECNNDYNNNKIQLDDDHDDNDDDGDDNQDVGDDAHADRNMMKTTMII